MSHGKTDIRNGQVTELRELHSVSNGKQDTCRQELKFSAPARGVLNSEAQLKQSGQLSYKMLERS